VRAPLARVGDLAEQIRGVTYAKGDASDEPRDGYVPILRAGNISDEGLSLSDLVFVPAARVSDRQFLKRNDVLVAASSGSLDVVGKAALVNSDVKAGFGAFCKLLRPGERVHPAYFAHFFKTPAYRGRVSALAAGANINNLRNEDLDDLTLPLPSTEEQHRIAGVLDRAEALRAKRRAALAQVDGLTQAIFLEMFGDPSTNPKAWPIGRVRDLLESASYGTSEKAGLTGGYPVLRMNNLTSTGEIDLSDLKFMSLSNAARERYTVRRGDVLFNRTNSADLVGKSALYRGTEAMAYAGYLIRLRVNRDNLGEYLSAFLNSAYAKAELRRMGKSIIGMANINASEIQAMPIAQPPLSLQRQFAHRAAAVDTLKASHRASLAQLDALFASLQHRAFRGEL
jgi:type I restriction enzyme S subunit